VQTQKNIEEDCSLESAEPTLPLVVDLDGTLILTDSLIESALALIRHRPFNVFAIFYWLLRGVAHMKEQIARRAPIDVSSLPYHMNLLLYLRNLSEEGRTLILATGASAAIATQVQDYLQLFEKVFSSDSQANLSGAKKAELLVREFGPGGFDYIGNSAKDMPVWRAARRAMVSGSPGTIQYALTHLKNIERVFPWDRPNWRMYSRSLRLYQWLKNLLVILPLMAAHRFDDIPLATSACLAFISFGLCASSVYVLNDLLDLPDDRRHPTKRHRPFASGALALTTGLWMIPVLLCLSVGIALLLPTSYQSTLAAYFALTLAYSVWLKRFAIVDVIVLAMLFTIRIIAGSAAVALWLSPWLLALSMFLFTSLALVKRYAELVIMRVENGPNARARGYVASDGELLSTIGVACGVVAVLVLVFYITTGTAQLYYGRHEAIWLVCPVLLFWICYIWMTAHRGEMIDDPLVFALRDRMSRGAIGVMAILMLLAI